MLKKELFTLKTVRGILRAFYGDNKKWMKLSNREIEKLTPPVLEQEEPTDPEPTEPVNPGGND